MRNVALLVFTDGRNDLLKRTLESFNEMVLYQFSHKFIVSDNPQRRPPVELTEGFIVVGASVRLGYCDAIQTAWDALKYEDVNYVFHLEDDFIFNRLVPLNDMIDVLEYDSRLAQMALVRKPVNDRELAAGNIIDVHPPTFYERKTWNGHVWYETNFSFTNNPNIYKREITHYRYPNPPHGEGKFSAALRDLGYRFGFWGDKEPWIEHIGNYKAQGGFY